MEVDTVTSRETKVSKPRQQGNRLLFVGLFPMSMQQGPDPLFKSSVLIASSFKRKVKGK